MARSPRVRGVLRDHRVRHLPGPRRPFRGDDGPARLLRPAAAVGRLMRLTAGSRTWDGGREGGGVSGARRSEEHTSELQSRENLVCRLLLEKKNEKPHSATRARATGGS